MKSKNKKIGLDFSSTIGFFDSGIGGLTILKEFISLPISRCIYVADTANMPYGNKTLQEIEEFSQKIVKFLIDQGATTIIISCHTATALALEHLQKKFKDVTFVGVIDVVTTEAVQRTKNNRIGLIATKATIASGAHRKAILERNPKAQLFEQACPLLASAVELETHQGKELDELLSTYIKPLVEENIDTLILGSTHYDVIRERIKLVIPSHINLISAHKHIMEQFTYNKKTNKKQLAIQYFVSGDINLFLESAKKIFIINPINAQKLSLPLISNESFKEKNNLCF